MFSIANTGCCGVRELVDISQKANPVEVLKGIAFDLISQHRPFVIFTGVTKREITDHASNRLDNYGGALQDYIKEHDLGPVMQSKARRNYTGNEITVWVWTPSWRNFLVWAQGMGVYTGVTPTHLVPKVTSLPNDV